MCTCVDLLSVSPPSCVTWSERVQTAGAARDPTVSDGRFVSGALSSIPENAAMCPRARVIFGRAGVLSVQTGRSSSPGRIDMNSRAAQMANFRKRADLSQVLKTGGGGGGGIGMALFQRV